MSPRLVLGWNSIVRALLRDADARTIVLAPQEDLPQPPTGDNVVLRRGDPSAEASLTGLDVSIESVFIVTPQPSTAIQYAQTARAVFDGHPIIAYLGPEFNATQRKRLSEYVTDTVDTTSVVSSEVMTHILGDRTERALALRRVLKTIDGNLAVVAHDNPDPDAIASAVGLAAIARSVGVEATPWHAGSINHRQNRALINLLDLDLQTYTAESDLDGASGVALVDHARPGVNDQLPDDMSVDIVVDHHPPVGEVTGRFVDIRHEVGATSTLITEYFEQLDVPYSTDIATALLFGILVDTDTFTRQTTPADFDAAERVSSHTDFALLEQIDSPTVSQDTLETIARAIRNRTRHKQIITSFLGDIFDRDTLAQAAEQLLTMEDVTVTFVCGIHSGTIYCSGRARGAYLDLGETFRRAFDHIGSAGGHAEMAGAQIPVGMLVEDADTDPLAAIEEIITRQFLEAVTESVPTVVDPESSTGVSQSAYTNFDTHDREIESGDT